jgi:hypothetical protein
MDKWELFKRTEGVHERKGTGSAVPHGRPQSIGFSRWGTVFGIVRHRLRRDG